jgi:DNA primase
MERESVTFPEALEMLARRANLPIPEKLGRPNPEGTSRPQLLEVLQWAELQFHKALLELPAAEPARSYLRERGFSDETIRSYRLGYSPNDSTWLVNKANGRFAAKLLLEAKLAGSGDRGPYDFFRNRVLFPIHNEQGQAVSFGGRVLPGSQDPAKYKNGSDSTVFHKSKLLYGLDKARDAIRKTDQVLVVEGYTDCIVCHQQGILNVVGTLGTALTDSHVTMLKRFARRVVLSFDGDDAGQAAARRAVERFLAQDVDLRILTLPEKLDPAEFLAAYNAEEFQQRVDASPEAWEFLFRSARAEYGVDSIDGRQRILEEMLQLLSQVPQIAGSLRESLLIANLAQRLQLSESAVRDRLQSIHSSGSRRVRVGADAAEARQTSREVSRILNGRLSRDDRLECDLLEHVLAAPESIGFVARGIEQAPLRNDIISRVLTTGLWEFEEQGELSLPGLLARLEDPELKNLVVWMDEQILAKDLAEKMRESGLDEDGCPLLLKRSLENLNWREAEQSQQSVAAQLSQTDGVSPLDEATEALLRQAAEFHLKRATKKSTV